MQSNNPQSSIPCTECQAGLMRRSYVTYFTWLMDELITVPDFPAWVCDVCGRREYDQGAVSRLNLILNPNAGKATHKRPSPAAPDRKTAQPPAS